MKENLIREFDKAQDMPMLNDWLAAHCRPAIPAEMLPSLGIVLFNGVTLEEQAALWLYMDNSVGVCFCERVVTRPGLSLKESKAIILEGLEFLKQRAATMNYGVMFVRCYPAIAKCLKGKGYFEDDRPVISLFTTTKEEPHA